MNKNTSYVILAFLIGIIVTQYFLSAKTADKPPLVKLEDPEPLNTPAESALLIKRKIGHTTHVSEVLKDTPLINQNPVSFETTKSQKNAYIPAPEPKRRVVELTLDEQNIANLERNINDLSVKVVMHKEDRGWRVQYLFPDNPMASMGLANNDLVLYDLLQSARANPKTARLTSRLENVFATLER